MNDHKASHKSGRISAVIKKTKRLIESHQPKAKETQPLNMVSTQEFMNYRTCEEVSKEPESDTSSSEIN